MMKKIYVLTCLMIFVLILASCGRSSESDTGNGEARLPEPNTEVSLVIILGNHANAYGFTSADSPILSEIIERTFRRGRDNNRAVFYADARGRIAIIVNEGRPRIQHMPDEVTLFSSSQTTGRRDMYIESMTNGILEHIFNADLRPTSEEVDLLASIALARRHFNANPAGDGVEQHILILGGGLSTTGHFDMTRINIQDGTPEEVVSRIPRGGFHDLDGIHVTFLGLGNFAGPQHPDLPRDSVVNCSVFHNQLVGIWEEVFFRKGATFDRIHFTGTTGEPMLWFEDDPDGTQWGFPRVTVVHLVPERPDPRVVGGTVYLPYRFIPPIFVFGAVELDFLPDSSTFRNRNNAIDIIWDAVDKHEGIRDYLYANPDMRVYVVGSIARVSPQSNQRHSQISAGRARSVADVLRGFGIPDDRIVEIDAGVTPFSWRNHDEFVGTHEQQQRNRQSNRVVAIIPEGNINGRTTYFYELFRAGYIDNDGNPIR